MAENKKKILPRKGNRKKSTHKKNLHTLYKRKQLNNDYTYNHKRQTTPYKQNVNPPTLHQKQMEWSKQLKKQPLPSRKILFHNATREETFP